MKKIILFVCAIFICLNTSAQSFFNSLPLGMRLSAHAGVNLSTFSSENDIDPRLGWQIGVNADIPLVKEFNLLGTQGELFLYPGVQFITKGGVCSSKGGTDTPYGAWNQDLKWTYNLNYINVPVRVGFREVGSSTAWSAFLGPYFGYGLSAKEKMTGNASWGQGGNSYNRETDLFEKVDYKHFDIGITTGLRCEVLKWKAFAQFSVEYGLVNNYNDSHKNSSYLLSLGYCF